MLPNFMNINGKIYYCRKSMTYYELIISSIAKYLGIESVGYLMAKKDVRLAPMYDGKWSFSSLPPLLLISEKDRSKTIENIIEHFFNTASLSSIKNFVDYYEKFDVKDLEALILSISSNNNINFNMSKICTNFIKRREIITKILRK